MIIPPEEPLNGGNVNDEVVRIGDTVRRTCSSASPAIHRLLNHLEVNDFDQAPRFLGVDEKGREILSYQEGECTIKPNYWLEDQYLISAATMLKHFHDLTATFIAEPDDKWAFQYPDVSKHEVICHNDFAPYNLISSNNRFIGVIDFDLAGPGPRVRDIAYAAYWLVPLSVRNDDMRDAALQDVRQGCKRLKLFCSSYGTNADGALLDMVSEVLLHMSDENVAIDTIGQSATERLKAQGQLDHWRQENEAFGEFKRCLQDNIE